MNQAFDMKRLHMGCGESLQSHLPHAHASEAGIAPATNPDSSAGPRS